MKRGELTPRMGLCSRVVCGSHHLEKVCLAWKATCGDRGSSYIHEYLLTFRGFFGQVQYSTSEPMYGAHLSFLSHLFFPTKSKTTRNGEVETLGILWTSDRSSMNTVSFFLIYLRAHTQCFQLFMTLFYSRVEMLARTETKCRKMPLVTAVMEILHLKIQARDLAWI